MNDEEIMVSICCITYNHERYIRDALDGFLMQKTNFKYEIIIHDDASTDRTQEIIREYERKYPDIIKPIYQVENQYQKGKKASLIALRHVKGKFVALCEGDDYWIDENKLQIQVDYMQKNEQCALCFHDACVLDMKNNQKQTWMWYDKRFWKKNGNYNAGQLNLIDFIPTASYVFRRETIDKIPNWFEKCLVGDLPLKLIATSLGYAHYIDKNMSIYRVGTGQSAMDKINKQNENFEKEEAYWRKIEWILDQFNDFSDYKYDKELDLSKGRFQKKFLIAKNEFKTLVEQKKYRIWLSRREKIIFFLKAYFPRLYEKIKGFKKLWKKQK